MITIINDGPLIASTNYWQSPLARAGKVYCSINAGTIRVLLPPAQVVALPDIRAAQYAVLSRGPWPEMRILEAVEIMFEDGSESPYTLHLSAQSFDMFPGDPGASEWRLSVWIEGLTKAPELACYFTCYWRRVPRIPCLKPWR